MGARSLIVVVAVVATGACGHPAASPNPPTPAANLREKIAHDFETAVVTSKDAYVALFDFAAVGEMEILLRRLDLNGRDVGLTDQQKEMFAKDDGTPFPETRERRNVGNFYPILAQRTVGTGGCKGGEPRGRYGRLLGQPYEPLPPGTPDKYELLRTHANAWLAKGGVAGITCSGGEGGLAVVYTQRDNARGYDLITIYDD
jgi:hypothetical protein